jgi:hypothetical protein
LAWLVCGSWAASPALALVCVVLRLKGSTAGVSWLGSSAALVAASPALALLYFALFLSVELTGLVHLRRLWLRILPLFALF